MKKYIFIIIGVIIVGGLYLSRDVFDDNVIDLKVINDLEDVADKGDDVKVGIKVNNKAPEFMLNDFKGREVSLSDFKNDKPVFINFWATWCPFCVDELSVMDNIQSEFKDQYITLAINRGEGLDDQKEYLQDLGIGDSMIFLVDPDDDIYKQYGGFAMPYSLFLDSKGIIRDVKFGPLTEEELRDKINNLLN
jgi:thiol-disulfide isomerase/thioredoxin